MDASAFIDREAWEKILTKLGLEDIEISDNRYNHVVHMQVSNLQDDDIDFCWMYTDKKENQISLIYKELRNGAVAKSYMTDSLLIYDYIFAPFLIY